MLVCVGCKGKSNNPTFRVLKKIQYIDIAKCHYYYEDKNHELQDFDGDCSEYFVNDSLTPKQH